MEKLIFKYLSLDEIDISISNVRKTRLEEGIEELADSIKEIGVQQPVVVLPKENNRYKLIIGQRRYLACKKLRLKEIPALITTVKDETDATIKSFSENIHRLDLKYRDKMQAAIELLNTLHSIDKVAKRLGVTSQTVRNYLGYSAVPEPIKEMVDKGKLNPTTALRIWRKIPDETQAIKIAKKIQEIPRSETRGRIIDVARENPNKSLEEIVNIVKGLRKITIHVTQNIYNALNNASKEYESTREDIIIDVIEEWLKKKDLLNDQIG